MVETRQALGRYLGRGTLRRNRFAFRTIDSAGGGRGRINARRSAFFNQPGSGFERDRFRRNDNRNNVARRNFDRNRSRGDGHAQPISRPNGTRNTACKLLSTERDGRPHRRNTQRKNGRDSRRNSRRNPGHDARRSGNGRSGCCRRSV